MQYLLCHVQPVPSHHGIEETVSSLYNSRGRLIRVGPLAVGLVAGLSVPQYEINTQIIGIGGVLLTR
jgi:hypothetical protein